MIRFIIHVHEVQLDHGLDRQDYVTLDADIPELEAMLTRGGRGESGFESWSLKGAQVLPDQVASSISKEPQS